MRLRRNNIAHFFILLLIISCEVSGQESESFGKYAIKYPRNSVIITSLKQELIIQVNKGKPRLNLSEYKEYLALNDNADYFSNSQEKFGSIYKLKDIEAYSLVPEKGGYKKIQVTSFNKTHDVGNNLFYDDVTSYNFTFPAIAKGTKMITSIHKVSEESSFPYRFYFGDYFPCDENVFTVICPENVEIKFKIFGRDTSLIRFSSSVKSGKKVYTWCASNPKSYIRDDYAPDGDYYMPHVVVHISKYNYKGKTIIVNNSIDDLYNIEYERVRNINKIESAEIKALADSLANGCKSNREKVSKIYSWVQKNIKYVAFEDGVNGYIPREANLVLQKKYGDCKDKSSLLVAMLKSQGLNASFTWVGTREIPYRFSDSATDFNFNHMVAVWWDENNKPVILDGTTLHNSLENIPAFIQGKECLIDNGPGKYKVYTIPIASPEKNIIYDSLSVELKGDTLTGKGYSIITGELRSTMLEYFEGKNPNELPEIINKMMPKASNKFLINSVNPAENYQTDSIFKYYYQFYLPDYLSKNQNIAYLNLNLDRFPAGMNLKDDRWIPVEINSAKKHIFICTFKIPQGYKAGDIPRNSFFSDKLFGYDLSYKINDQQIILKTIVTLNFQVIEDREMARFREMLNLLNSNYNRTIPLYKNDKQ